jgi:hypothetical protein
LFEHTFFSLRKDGHFGSGHSHRFLRSTLWLPCPAHATTEDMEAIMAIARNKAFMIDVARRLNPELNAELPIYDLKSEELRVGRQLNHCSDHFE